MPKALTIADLLANIPRMRAATEKRIAALRSELASLESDLARLNGLGAARRGRPPGAKTIRRGGTGKRAPRGGLRNAVAALFAGEGKGKSFARADLVAAGVKAGLTKGSAQAGLTALKKAKIVTSAGRGLFKAGPNIGG